MNGCIKTTNTAMLTVIYRVDEVSCKKKYFFEKKLLINNCIGRGKALPRKSKKVYLFSVRAQTGFLTLTQVNVVFHESENRSSKR